jgi:DHA1 family tetracycline resistance protein-like MFS transporter
LAISALTAVYALAQLLATPALGVLSDRYGRRPVLLVSLFGSAVGYLLFGIGGALWILFAGRIIDGLTAGNVSALYAIVADISTPAERTLRFGALGAASGLGLVLGPVLGGSLAQLTPETPLYCAAALTLAMTLWGVWALPESKQPAPQSTPFNTASLNPFGQMVGLIADQRLRVPVLAAALLTLSFALLLATLPVLTMTHFGWGTESTGALFAVFGTLSIITQALLLRQLLPRLGERGVALVGLSLAALGFALTGIAVVLTSAALLPVAAATLGIGVPLASTALSGISSQVVGAHEQGRMQGSNQAVQALARVIGPLWGGWLYLAAGAATTYWVSTVHVLVALGLVALALAHPSSFPAATAPAAD